MPEIKTKDVVGNTVKTVDRVALAGERMKDAYIRTKKAAEHSVDASGETTEEYAADRVSEGTEAIIQETIYQTTTQKRNPFHKRKPEFSQYRQAQKPAQSPQTPEPNTTALPAIPKAEGISVDPSKAAHHVRVNTPRTIKTVEHTGEAIKQMVKSASQNTVKTANRSIKTASSTVKTVEQVGSATVKTVEVVSQAAKKTAIESAKTAQRIRLAAKSAATTVKALAAATAKAVKAIIAAAKELTAAIVAGGWVAVLVILLVVICSAGLMLASDEDDTEILPISEEVKAYEPLIQQYAKEHGIGEYVLLIQAVMMQESGGRGTDPMQCSECNFNTLYPHRPGGITDPEYSINVGIQNLADCLSVAQCESPVDMDAVKLALQGYNYGQGYITWAMNQYGEYSKANAIEFSIKTAETYGWNSYGDMDYVPHVLRYYPLGQIFYDPDTSNLIVEVARTQIGNVGGEPYWSWYGFTGRVDWCACFVSWCANQCGYIEAGVIPKFSGCEWGVYWFKQNDQWAGRSITPEPGMIIFFDWEDEEGGGLDGGADHVGIVESVENGRVYTIEGNTADSCRERNYPIGHFEILGYGMPTY